MALEASKFSAALLPALTNGTYPDDEKVLTAELHNTDLTPLLKDISSARKTLEDDVRSVSRQQTSDVNEWIAQARKAQEDIARCKVVAAEIVREHEQVQKLQESVHDARSKLSLLRGELEFTSSLEQELQTVASIKLDMDQIEGLLDEHPADATTQLRSLQKGISEIHGVNASRILQQRYDYLTRELHMRIEAALQERISFGKTESESWLKIQPDTADSHTQHNSINSILEALDSLGTLKKTTEVLSAKLDSQILEPILDRSSRQQLQSYETAESKLTIHFGSSTPATSLMMESLRQVALFLQAQMPESLALSLVQRTMPRLIQRLTTDWLDQSIPLELSNIQDFHDLQVEVENLANTFKSARWPGARDLLEWKAQVPRFWLTKRRMTSLHTVRIALATTRGPTRNVERVETQTISKQDAAFAVNGAIDDWDAGWDAEAEDKTKQDEEDISAWDFDDKAAGPTQHDEDDAGDAWAWDDDGQQESNSPQRSRANKAEPLRSGTESKNPSDRQVTLAETYTITDIPDHIIEIIRKDIQDAQVVKGPTYSILHNASPSVGLLAIPTSVLTMFRAISPNYYTTSLNSGNMHLYNDAMYIVQTLRETMSTDLPTATSDTTAMEKFARSAYAREMDIQRTILGDILDGAQGFMKCTEQPYAMQCETAVSSTIDRIRAIQTEWKPILSHSALLQSIGALLAHVTSKIISDILDMEDIGAAESQALVEFCNQISSLNDLFLAGNSSATETEPLPMTAVYVPNWLRFQYLANILDSSLVDIKYLWTDSELRMEFSADEVVDLVRALFKETRQRKEAIAEILAS